MRILISAIAVATVSLMIIGIFCGAIADSDHHGRWGHHNGRGFHRRDRGPHRLKSDTHLKPVANAAYKETCGACHFVYQPGLLPSASWNKILGNLQDHFGQPVDIDDSSKEEIRKYLTDNAAEFSSAKPSVKIMKCLRGHNPDRITEIPYIRRTHRDIPSEVLARQAIGSLSHCSACHTSAAQGIYQRNTVAIPK